jgi:hypothetical protein
LGRTIQFYPFSFYKGVFVSDPIELIAASTIKFEKISYILLGVALGTWLILV